MHHFKNWIGACSAAVLHQSSCFGVHRSSGWSVRAPAGLLSPCFSILATVPSRPSTPRAAEGQTCSLCDGWLSTRFCQVFGEHSTLSVSFVSEKPSTVECTLTLELPSEQPHVSIHISEDITPFHILYHIMFKNVSLTCVSSPQPSILGPSSCFSGEGKKCLTAWYINTFTEFFGSSEQNWQLNWL